MQRSVVASSSANPAQSILSLSLYPLALIAWMAANPTIGLWVNLCTSLIFLVYASPVLVALWRITGRAGLAELATAGSVGFVVSGVVSTIIRLIGWPNWAVLAIFLAIALLLMAILRTGSQSNARQDDVTTDARGQLITTALSALVLLLPLSVVLVRAVLAGSGAFPKFIFYSDDAFDLAMIRSLLASPQIPPESLTFLNGSKPYHFGTLEAVANLVRLTGLQPHVAQFYVAFPVIECGIIGAAWLLLKRIGPGLPRLLAACILVVAFNSNQSDFKLSFRLFDAISHAVKAGSFAAEPSLQYLVVHLPTFGARMICWFLLALMFMWQRRLARWMAAVLVGSLALVDPFYFVAAGLLIGIWSVYRAIKEHSWQEILPPVLALAIGIVIGRLLGSGGTSFKVVFAPLACTYCTDNTVEIFRNLALLIAIGLGLTLCFWRHVAVQGKIWLLASLLLLLAINLTALFFADQPEPNFNWFRLAGIASMLIASFVALAIADTWPNLKRSGRIVVTLLVVVATLIPIGRIPMVSAQVAANPGRGSDVTQTAALAEAMQQIPVAGSVVVTNDLRYPVIDYRYTLKNPLVSALFGHQCYFCNGDGEADLPGAGQRLAEVQQLAAPDWSTAITDLASRNHWTHFLVHKNWSHPAAIPLRLVFENDQYAVYAF
ncbi:MAG TPA: hypothetical protein VM659_13035 [Dongiaceae bacterium]|nr:hypothetical protein [Dongiaceae bacterium]